MIAEIALAFNLILAQPSPAYQLDIDCVIYSETSKTIGNGSAVALGDSRFTAFHVVQNCVGQPEGEAYPEIDLYVMQRGDAGQCRNAADFEPVIYLGYPVMTDGRVTNELETDSGQVLRQGRTLGIWNSKTQATELREGMTIATVNRVRGGYSGGPVVSALDGRVVGMVIATDGTNAVIVPIEAICEKLR